MTCTHRYRFVTIDEKHESVVPGPLSEYNSYCESSGPFLTANPLPMSRTEIEASDHYFIDAILQRNKAFSVTQIMSQMLTGDLWPASVGTTHAL